MKKYTSSRNLQWSNASNHNSIVPNVTKCISQDFTQKVTDFKIECSRYGSASETISNAPHFNQGSLYLCRSVLRNSKTILACFLSLLLLFVSPLPSFLPSLSLPTTHFPPLQGLTMMLLAPRRTQLVNTFMRFCSLNHNKVKLKVMLSRDE